MPALLAKIFRLWHSTRVEQWWARTTQAVLEEMICDVRLRAVLAAQRGD